MIWIYGTMRKNFALNALSITARLRTPEHFERRQVEMNNGSKPEPFGKAGEP